MPAYSGSAVFVIEWWEIGPERSQAPELVSFAIWAASMGTSTSPIERLNSVAGAIVSKKRLRMGKKKRAMSTK